MKTRTFYLQPLAILVLFIGLIVSGCSPRNVEMLTVTGPDQLETNETGTFSAEANEDAKPPVSYTWDFGDSNSADGAAASHSFDSAGQYSVMVTATNRNGKASVMESKEVMVVDPPVPAEIITVLAMPTETDTHTPVQFSANVRGDAPLAYAWTFGDGSSGKGARQTHTFMEAGTYSITLEVSNEHGRDARAISVAVAAFEADYCADLAEMNAVFFERNSSILTDSGQQALAENLDILMNCPNLTVRVEGLAGPFERNPQDISDDRARAVQQHYMDNGVSEGRITTEGMGRAAGGSKKSGAEQFRRADTMPVH